MNPLFNFPPAEEERAADKFREGDILKHPLHGRQKILLRRIGEGPHDASFQPVNKKGETVSNRWGPLMGWTGSLYGSGYEVIGHMDIATGEVTYL